MTTYISLYSSHNSSGYFSQKAAGDPAAALIVIGEAVAAAVNASRSRFHPLSLMPEGLEFRPHPAPTGRRQIRYRQDRKGRPLFSKSQRRSVCGHCDPSDDGAVLQDIAGDAYRDSTGRESHSNVAAASHEMKIRRRMSGI